MAIESSDTTVSALPDITLPDVTGGTVSLHQHAHGRPCVVVFACNHCPYVQSIESALGLIAQERTDVAWVAICSNDVTTHPDDDIDDNILLSETHVPEAEVQAQELIELVAKWRGEEIEVGPLPGRCMCVCVRVCVYA